MRKIIEKLFIQFGINGNDDKILLRKRSVIETVNDGFKNICQVGHSRHRSVFNFLTNLIADVIAYHFLPKKTSLK